jgi:hypothetical protein
MSVFGVDTWYGSAASELVVGAIDLVEGDSIGTGAVKAVAATLVVASFGIKLGRAICADRGVRVPLSSSSSSSSSMSSALGPVGLSEGSTLVYKVSMSFLSSTTT